MLGWILTVTAMLIASTTLGLGYLVPMASSIQSMFLTLTAVLGMVLIASWDAFETQAASVSRDDEN